MRLLVTGGRDYNDNAHVWSVLDALRGEHGELVIIHGNAKGADRIADMWARIRGVPREPYPADWKKYGYRAGPIRNSQMLLEAQPDMVVAFPGQTGTADMVRKAEFAGVPVIMCEKQL